MEAHNNLAHGKNLPVSLARPDWSRRLLWAMGFLAVALITALAFGAYRQPELLLNLLGLRYCG